MAVFEFRPKYHVEEPMSAEEMALYSDKPYTVIRNRLEAVHALCTIGTRKYAPSVCNVVLNQPTDRENWVIEGYYTLKQAADMLGYGSTAVKNMLERYALPFKKQFISGVGSCWIKEKTVKKLESILSEADDIGVLTVDIAEICGVTRDYVNVYVRRLGIKKLFFHGKYYIPKESVSALVKEINQATARVRYKSEKDRQLEQLQKLHPLVKDVRCFDENWYPAAMPSFMEEW